MAKRITINDLFALLSAQQQQIDALLALQGVKPVATEAAATPAPIESQTVAEAVTPLDPPPLDGTPDVGPVLPAGWVYLDETGRKPSKSWIGLGGFKYWSDFAKAWTNSLFIIAWDDEHSLPKWAWDKAGTRPYKAGGKWEFTRDKKPSQPPRLIAESFRFAPPKK